MTKLQQGNKIVIKMLNKHENPSETSQSKRLKQKQNECMTKILSDCFIGTALPVLILCCTKSVWPKAPLDFEKTYFGVLLTILTMTEWNTLWKYGILT
jgi:hypothetical protein